MKEVWQLKSELLRRDEGGAIELVTLISKDEKAFLKWFYSKSTLKLIDLVSKYENHSLYTQVRNKSLTFFNDWNSIDSAVLSLSERNKQAGCLQ